MSQAEAPAVYTQISSVRNVAALPAAVEEEVCFQDEDSSLANDMSCLLEALHAKNVTLKKVVRALQRRVQELEDENQATESVCEQLREEVATVTHEVELLRGEAGGAAEQTNGRLRLGVGQEGEREEEEEEGRRRKGSGTETKGKGWMKRAESMSRGVGLVRMKELLRKINGARNGRSVTFHKYIVCCCNLGSFVARVLLNCVVQHYMLRGHI